MIAQGATSARQASQTYTVDSSLTLFSTSGKVGAFVSVTLKGYGAGETVNLTWDGAPLKSVTTSTTGTASTWFTAPEAVTGNHTVTGTGVTSGETASRTFAIVPSLTLAPTSGRVGTTVSVALKGFAAGESVAVTWDGGTTPLGTRTASTLGSATVTFVVPDAAQGAHTVAGAGSSGNSVSAPFTVVPAMTLSPTSGAVGTTVTVTMTGYAATDTVTLAWYDTTKASTTVSTVATSATGGATATFSVPEATSGRHKVQASGTGKTVASTFFTVNPSVALTPGSGISGDTVGASLKGYAAGETLSIKWYSTATSAITLATVTASSSGDATTTFVAPPSAAGTYKVEGAGAKSFSRASTTYAITTNATSDCILNPASGSGGTKVTLTCSGFQPGETVRLHWDSTSTFQKASFVASASGAGVGSFLVPDSTVGGHSVIAKGATSGIESSQP